MSVLAALACAGCLPLDDLSKYSRGEPADAGAADPELSSRPLQPTAEGLPLVPARPDARPAPGSGRSPPGSDTTPQADPDDVPAPALRPDGGAPGDESDGGAPPSLLPEVCAELPVSNAGSVASCYAISRKPLSWTAALAACEAWGGSLVSINTPDEDAALDSLLSGTVWIGANDREREGTMTWANADPFQFSRFAAGEPDNTFGIQDCVERRADSFWNDRVCSAVSFFVCERPLAP